MNNLEFSDEIRQIVDFAREEAGRNGYDQVLPEHLLLGIMGDEELSANVLMKIVTKEFDSLHSFVKKISPKLEGFDTPQDTIPFSVSSEKLLSNATEEAREMGSEMVEDYHLLLAILREENRITRLLEKHRFFYADIKRVCEEAQSLS